MLLVNQKFTGMSFKKVELKVIVDGEEYSHQVDANSFSKVVEDIVESQDGEFSTEEIVELIVGDLALMISEDGFWDDLLNF